MRVVLLSRESVGIRTFTSQNSCIISGVFTGNVSAMSCEKSFLKHRYRPASYHRRNVLVHNFISSFTQQDFRTVFFLKSGFFEIIFASVVANFIVAHFIIFSLYSLYVKENYSMVSVVFRFSFHTRFASLAFFVFPKEKSLNFINFVLSVLQSYELPWHVY